jgi:hypothetical protein
MDQTTKIYFDQVAAEVITLSRRQLLDEVQPWHARLYGERSAASLAQAETLELRWRAMVQRVQAGMDAAGRIIVNQEMAQAGYGWPYQIGSTPHDRIQHPLAVGLA